jgi:hypothetical protein
MNEDEMRQKLADMWSDAGQILGGKYVDDHTKLCQVLKWVNDDKDEAFVSFVRNIHKRK